MECHNEETTPLMNIKSVVSNRMCSGCGLCSSVCPKGSISMHFNTIGNILPKVDDTCIDCGLCSKVCPGSPNSPSLQTDCDDVFVGNIRQTYIGRSLNDNIYKNSQSGGIVTALIAYLLNNRLIDAAIVAKCSFGSPYPHTEAVIITDSRSLHETQKSIYTPVDILSKLREARQFSKVAVVGLPCQLEALHIAQEKGLFKNVVYRIGLICDRILARSIYLSLKPQKWIEEKNNMSDVNLCYKTFFRDKNYNGYKAAYITYENSIGETIASPPYPRHYLKDFYTHPRCRICFDKINIYADVTCGDPWGLDNVDWVKGDSLIISRTFIGEKLLHDAENTGNIKLTTCDKQNVIVKQGIKSRKRRCQSTISVYKENGWVYPEFYKSIELNCNGKKEFVNQRKNIKCFIKTEKLTLTEILQKAEKTRNLNERKAKYKALKENLKMYIKKIIRR